MSHAPHRKEKDCLNCGTIVQGHFCHECGQENVIPKETFWHMFTHFFYDITHFDSKFFETLKDLLIRPGFLSKEYMAGRRASYLHPVKMYVFTSAIFFLLFFSFFKPKTGGSEFINEPLSLEQRENYLTGLREMLKDDTGNVKLKAKIALATDTNNVITKRDILKGDGAGIHMGFSGNTYSTIASYDSSQKALPPDQRDGWFNRRFKKKEIEINEKYKDNPEEASEKLVESFLHRLPYVLFISLPLFALILKLAYIRRKQFYYADHGVFTIHLYIFSFLILLTIFSVDRLEDVLNTGYEWIPMLILFLLLFFYLYKAMRNFYGQRRGKTFLKFLIVALCSLVMMLILLACFVFFSAFTL